MASGGPELPPKTEELIRDATATIADSTTRQNTLDEIIEEMASLSHQKVTKL